MKIENNYSITQLFVSKEISVAVDNHCVFTVVLPVLKEAYTDTNWNRVSFLWLKSLSETKEYYYKKVSTPLEGIKLILFDSAQYKEYAKLSSLYKYYLQKIIPDIEFDYATRNLIVNDLIINDEIWDHILYLLKLSYGDKVTLPPVFDSEEARQLYLAQQEREEKIKKIKSRNEQDKEGLMKAFLAITYAFPSLTFDYLFNQTMAQIQWLQKYAAGAVSYEVNAQAFAAGNVKKGKKLDFFIK